MAAVVDQCRVYVKTTTAAAATGRKTSTRRRQTTEIKTTSHRQSREPGESAKHRTANDQLGGDAPERSRRQTRGRHRGADLA